MPFTPRFPHQIARDIASKVVSRTQLNDVNIGSSLQVFINAIAYELASTEARMFDIRKSYSLKYAQGTDLDERCAELPPVGISRLHQTTASGAVLQIDRSDTTAEIVIPAGSIVSRSKDGIQYQITRDHVMPVGIGRLENVPIAALSVGAIGNVGSGEIDTIVEMPEEITAVLNTRGIYTGVDKEDDESLRARAQRYVRSLNRTSPSAAEYLGTSFISSDNTRFKFSSVYESEETPGYAELVVDDGTGLTAYEAQGTDVGGRVPPGGQSFITHQRPATQPIQNTQITIIRNGVAFRPNARDFVSIPERGIIRFQPGVLLEGDQYSVTNYNIYKGLVFELQEEIEGNSDNGNIVTGFRAAGCRLRVVPPDVFTVRLDARIIVSPEQDVNVVNLSVRQGIESYINDLDIGQPLRVADAITELMITQRILSISFFTAGTDIPLADIYPANGKTALRTELGNISVSNVL